MATTPTSIGPIGARQINRNLYVGQSDMATIQAAVNVAAKIGGLFVVVIPFDYAGADLISALTGGSASVELQDLRGGQVQTYAWSGTQFVPTKFQQATGFVSMGTPPAIPAGSTALSYSPTGTSGAGTGTILVSGNTGAGMPSLQLSCLPGDGTLIHTFMRCEVEQTTGFNRVIVPAVLHVNRQPSPTSYNLWLGNAHNTGGKGMTVASDDTLNVIDFQGMTVGGAYDQTIRLNYLGGSVQIGPLTFDAAGNLTGIGAITADSIAADDADFTTCEVANSPVRTFANTPDGPGQGMVWPPDGIPVSVGDHWQSPSIDPATLATWPATGIAVSTGTAWGTPINPASLTPYPPAGIPQSTGTAWGTPISAASLATWPAAGVPVSTGSAWGTPIPAANIPLLNAANTFTANQTFSANAAVGGVLTTAGALLRVLLRGAGNTGTANINADAATLALNPGAAGVVWLSCDQGAGTRFGNAAGGYVGSVDISGNATFNGQLIIQGLSATQKIQVGGVDNGATSLRSDGTHTFLDAQSGNLQLNVTRTGTPQVIVNGTIFANGSITSGASKSFRINHPLKEDKDLVHACVEGPEIAVFYRGEGATEGGWATITLPDYFEALTMPTNRTVQLSALFEDEADQVGMLAASRVKDGQFKVWSGLPAQKFYWEVKAVRKDIESLEVEPERTELIYRSSPTGEDAK